MLTSPHESIIAPANIKGETGVIDMALMRWEPKNEVENVRRQMARLVEQMFGGALRGMPSLEGMGAFNPNVEVYTTNDSVVIKAELPGIDPNEVNVELTENALHLTGEMKKEEEIKEDNYYRSERSYGHFERVIPLPDRVKEGEAKASFKNGVLTIRAPLAEEIKRPQAHKLKIENEG